MTIVGSSGASAATDSGNAAMPLAHGDRARFAGPITHRADLDERPTLDSTTQGQAIPTIAAPREPVVAVQT